MRHVTGMCLAVALSWSIGAAAQDTTSTQEGTATAQTDRATTGAQGDRTDEGQERQRSDAARSTADRQAPGQAVTVIGCIQRERDVFDTRGITNDEVVMTSASITEGRAEFERLEAEHRARANTGSPGPYGAERDEVITQHDGTEPHGGASATSGMQSEGETAKADSAGDPTAEHDAGVTGATGTSGTYGGDRDADRDRTKRTVETAEDADAVTGDDHHERTGTAGIAADRSTGAYDADRDGRDATTGTSGTAGAMSTDDRSGRVFNLTGDKQEELQDMVGRRVEVKGHVAFSDDMVGMAPFEAQRQAPMGEVEGDVRHEASDEGAASATNTGGGWLNPEEVEAAAGRGRLEDKPQLEVASFRDMGACDAQR